MYLRGNMIQEEGGAGKHEQRKAMQMEKVTHLWWKGIWLQEGYVKSYS